MNNIEIEAGLWTQIRKLKKRIDSLDMDKVDPVELKSAIDSLKDMESRYSEMQERKKQRRLDKETKEKATPLPIESAPADAIPAPVVDQAPVTENIELAPPIETPVEKDADIEVSATRNEDVIESFISMTNPKTNTQHLFIEQVSPDTWNLVNYNTVIATNEGGQIKLNYGYYSQTTRKIQNKILGMAQQMGVPVVDMKTGQPMELGNKPKKQVKAPVEEAPVEEVPMAAEKKEATTSKYALDDIVEPVYGSAGSYGRVMRYDADKDMAYVHWDSGKLQAEHGFGAYKGSDLRKRASLDKKADDMGEPMGDVWNLESKDEEFAANILSGIASKAIEGDVGEQQYLCSLWGEKWPQVKKKLEAEGSTWYVWWMDGVREFLRGMQEADEQNAAPEVKSEQDGLGYGGDCAGIAVAPKRDEDVSLTSGKYTGDMDKDLKVLMPHIVADGVSGNDRELSDWLVERAKQIYKHNPEWGKKVARENDAARDFLWQFMEHWMKSKQSGAPMESSLTASAEPKAIGWWMQEPDSRPKHSALETDGIPDANDIVETYINGNISDAKEWIAENPDLFPEALNLIREQSPKDAQRFMELCYPYRKAAGLKKAAEWAVEYYPNDSDKMKVHKGFQSKDEADKWVKAENIHDRGTDVSVYQIKEASLNKTATSWRVLPNGDLEITMSKDIIQPGKTTYQNISEEDLDTDKAMYEFFEPVIANGLSWIAPEQIGALTDAPILSDSPGDDQGNPDPNANYWWYPNYQIESPARELFENGKVVFKKATEADTSKEATPMLEKKEAVGNPGEGQVMELNLANRKWTAKRTSGAGSPDAWVIFDDQGKQVMAITMSERELSQPELEQIVFNELGKKDLVRATLNVDLSIMKKGHKVKLVAIDLARNEAKFASLESATLAGWTKLDRFDITIDAKHEPKLDRHCKECGVKIPLSFEDDAVCRDCARKKDHPHKEADLMPLSKNETTIRIKSTQTLIDLAKNCPDCYKKFLKFAQEKGLHIQADDLTQHVEDMRTKMTQTKEVLQTQTQAAEVVPEAVVTEAALPPKPAIPLPDGMKWFYNRLTNTWEMIADDTLRY